MTLNDYGHMAESFMDPELGYMPVIYPALGLAGEAGEVADKIKKAIRDNRDCHTDGLRRAIALEIGDVLWNCAMLARDLGYTLEEVARMNIGKLESRKQRHTLSGSGDNR